RKVGEQFMATFNAYQKMIDDNKTDDLSGSQPTKGNIRGGLTTIEEKAFGNLQKIGKKAKYVGVLDKAEAPTGPGLWFMDTSSAAAEAVTLWAAAGFVAHFFPTGQGNIIGNPIEPVIKLTANPLTAKTMSEHVDYDCSAILRGEMTLDQSGDNLLQMLIRTCNGRLTAQEVLGHEEFVLTKLYESA
nr:UxaA family hydrolase [Desulfobacterales bacterium]